MPSPEIIDASERRGDDARAATGLRHASTRILLIFIGGAAGALLRTVLLSLPALSPGMEPLALTTVNLVGAFALGWLLGAVTAPTPRAEAARALLGTGLLGGFTSYSALIFFSLPAGGTWPMGLGLAVITLIAGVAAATAGLAIGERITRRSPEPDAPGETS